MKKKLIFVGLCILVLILSGMILAITTQPHWFNLNEQEKEIEDIEGLNITVEPEYVNLYGIVDYDGSVTGSKTMSMNITIRNTESKIWMLTFSLIDINKNNRHSLSDGLEYPKNFEIRSNDGLLFYGIDEDSDIYGYSDYGIIFSIAPGNMVQYQINFTISNAVAGTFFGCGATFPDNHFYLFNRMTGHQLEIPFGVII